MEFECIPVPLPVKRWWYFYKLHYLFQSNYEGMLKLPGTLLSSELPLEDKEQILEQDLFERIVFECVT